MRKVSVGCAHTDNAVVDSREHELGIRRRRKCAHCGARWTTYEITADQYDRLAEQAYAEKRVCNAVLEALRGVGVLESEQ